MTTAYIHQTSTAVAAWGNTYAGTSSLWSNYPQTYYVQPTTPAYRTQKWYTIQTPPLDVVDGDTGRRPPPREFNRYLNGSDLLEEFIGFLGGEGVRSSEFMGLPVELFVKWLIIRACEQDQEEPNVTLELPAPTRRTPRCVGCGRFMRPAPVLLHEPCAPRYFARELVAA